MGLVVGGLGIPALGMEVLVGAGVGGSAWGVAVVQTADVSSTSYTVGQRPPRYRRHPSQDLSASKGPPRSIAPRCETTGSTPPRRLMTQVPAGVHFHPCLPSSSVLAPKVSPSHGKERRKQQLNSRLDNTAHPPSQSRDEAMQELKRGRSF